MPPRKRVASIALADDTSSVEARIRRHLATISASQAAILSLLDQLAPAPPPAPGIFIPDDIVRHILEFVLRRRRCAQFGASGSLEPASFNDPEREMVPLRLINKQWARIGGELVRRLCVPKTIREMPRTLSSAFPNTSMLAMQRCVVTREIVNAFSAAIKVFSHRPKHLIFVVPSYCSAVGKLVLDCQGMLVDEDDFYHDCEELPDSHEAKPNRIKIINSFLPRLDVSWDGPDRIWASSQRKKSLDDLFCHPMNLIVDASAFDDTPSTIHPNFRAVTVYIAGRATRDLNVEKMAKWFEPKLWQNGRRPPVVLPWYEPDGPALTALAQTLSDQLHMEFSSSPDWSDY
jgi:hypothetical protein